MGFSMRINFVDVITDKSLESIVVNKKKIGYAFDIRLSYYRGLFLSCIEEFELTVDGEIVPMRDITFGINGKIIGASLLSQCASEFWGLLEPARIEVMKDGGLLEGEHEIDLKLMLRIPYMPIPQGGGDDLYMPLNSCGKKRLTLREGGY